MAGFGAALGPRAGSEKAWVAVGGLILFFFGSEPSIGRGFLFLQFRRRRKKMEPRIEGFAGGEGGDVPAGR